MNITEITSADVVAWLRATAPEGMALGVSTEYHKAFVANFTDRTISYDCTFGDTPEAAIAELREKCAPSKLAAMKRDEAQRLLREAEAIESRNVVAMDKLKAVVAEDREVSAV